MALSMFARTTVCTNRLFCQQAMRLATQPAFTQRLASALTVKSLALKESKTPILDSVRSFRTSGVRLSDEKPHDHSKLWVVEKATAALLVPLVPLGLLVPNKIFDSLLAILITAHSFWGLEACVVEYVRVLLFGPMIPKVAMGAVYFVTAVMLGGLFYLNLNDIGLCRAFWKIWRNMRKPKPAPPKPAPPPPPEVHCCSSKGLEAIAVDYVRASIFGPLVPKLAIALVYLLCIATLGGLFYVITHDIGICNSVRQLWAIRSENKA